MGAGCRRWPQGVTGLRQTGRVPQPGSQTGQERPATCVVGTTEMIDTVHIAGQVGNCMVFFANLLIALLLSADALIPLSATCSSGYAAAIPFPSPFRLTYLHTCSGSCGCASTRCRGSVLPRSRAAVMLPPAPPMLTTRAAGSSCAPAVGTRILLLRRADDRKDASAELTARLQRYDSRPVGQQHTHGQK